MSQLRRRTAEKNHVVILQERLAAPSLGVDEELYLCHALAKELEDLGDYRGAFASLARGKQRKLQKQPYKPEFDDSLFAALQREYGAQTISSASGHDSREPIFILGMPRTGTTLLERILSNHSQVFAAGELQNFALLCKQATQTPSRFVMDADTLAAGRHIDLEKLGRDYIQSTRPRTGHCPHFIDKMPLNFFYIGLIRLALPAARIICLVRNPMDTCLSNYRQLFGTSFAYYNYAYDLLATGRYYLNFSRLMDHWNALMPGHIHTVCYENLISQPEAEARALLEYCDLPWEERCLDIQSNTSPVATASAVQVRRPIYSTSVDRWRRYMPEVQSLLELLQAGNAMRGDEWPQRPPPAQSG